LAAVSAFDAQQLVEDYSKRRLAFLVNLSTWTDFGKGWGKRVADVQAKAIGMIA
jgi:lysozyme family protein